MVFFLILLMLGFSTIYLFTTNLDTYNNAVQAVNDADLSRIQENVRITSAYLNAQNRLVLNVTNQGTELTQLTRLWIINQTDNQHFSYTLNNMYLAPGESISNTTQVSLKTGKSYAIRLVTGNGNTVGYNLATGVKARLNLYISSPVLQSNNVTLSFFVTNNDTSTNSIYNLIPTVTSTSGASKVLGPLPATVALLPQGQTAVFTYIFYVNATKGTLITFNSSFVGAPTGNYLITPVKVSTVYYAEQSGASGTASGIGTGTIATDGSLYFHRQSYLDGQVMDPSTPTSGYSYYVTVSSGSPIWFYTHNDTQTRTIPAGNWRLDIYYSTIGTGSSTANIKYEIVSLDGQTVYQTLLNTNWNLPNQQNYPPTDISRTDSISAVTINANQRLRCTISYVSGRSLRLYFDTTSYPSYLRTQIPNKAFPIYWVYGGGDFWMQVVNTGTVPFWVNYHTKAVWHNVATNMSYASFVIGFTDASYTSEQTINTDTDSDVIMVNSAINLHFQQPTTIPSRSGYAGNAIPHGTYDFSIHLEGYDALGYFVARVVYLGTVTW